MSFTPEVTAAIQAAAQSHRITSALLAAFVQTESSGRPFATRYELGAGRYVRDVSEHAIATIESLATETAHQMTSWGLMQIMGFNAREMGFAGLLPELCQAAVGLEWGCCWLKHLQTRFGIQPDDAPLDFDEALACAYNHGSPQRAPDGTWVVQAYVDRVKAYWQEFKAAGF